MSRRAPFPLTMRLHADGTLDEVVADRAYVHLEQMDDNCFWLGVTVGKNSVNVWIGSVKKKLTVSYEMEGSVVVERS